MEYSTNQFREYFLGICTEKDAEVLEREFLENSSVQEAVLAAESELIDEYLDGELSAVDHAHFLENYLVTKGRDEKVAEARAYRSFFQNQDQIQTVPRVAINEKTSFFVELLDWLTAKGLVTAGAIAILLLTGTVTVFIFTRSSDDLATKYASINKQDMTDLSRFNATNKLSLASGDQRGTNDTSSVRSGASSEVLMRLSLLPDNTVTDRFQLNVKRGSADIYSQDGLRAYDNSNGMELRVILPTIILEQGDHQIYVTSVSRPNDVMKYSFKVE